MDETEAEGFGSWIYWIAENFVMSFYNLIAAIFQPGLWLDWLTWNNTTEDKESLMRFVFYGASTEFFFVVFTSFLIIFAVGVWRNTFLWGVVRVLEGFGNTVGRFAAWAGLVMVLQQVVIVFMQRIFTRPDISVGFGIPLQFDISWFAEELKLFSPNGFTGYFLFKILMIIMVAMIFIQAWAFFYRSYLEWREGEASAGKYLDKDVLEMGEEPYDQREF